MAGFSSLYSLDFQSLYSLDTKGLLKVRGQAPYLNEEKAFTFEQLVGSDILYRASYAINKERFERELR
ncbi:hypothetical protein A4A71_05775 [Nicoletella semolina]|nr:hypothetical protein [Nicoletella semolina]